MKSKIPQPEFGKDETVPFKGDLLNREQEIIALTPMITKIASPATMALDAEWGAGKTAFIKMWKAHLNKEASARAFYFNAWETDFAADPLVPFMATIAKQLPEPDDSTELVEKGKALIPILVGDVVRKFVGKGMAEVAENAVEHLLAHNDKITEFKDALEDLAKTQKAKRIVIFVDELDRCRPDYAVKVLERIKHLFEVPGLVFVLATNRKQLCHSIKALYGAEFDADEYLCRFIEFDYTIKQPYMSTFISARLRDLEIDAFFSAENNHHIYEELHTMLKLLAKVCDFSLRGMEQLLMRVVLVLCTLEKKADGGYSINLTLLTFLIMARLRMREHYDKYIRGADWQGMVNHWESDLMAARIRWRNEDERAQLHAIAALTTAQVIMTWYSPLEHSDALNVISHYEKKAENASNDAREYYKEVARYVRHFIQNNSRGINLGFFVRKIEMLDQFRFSDDAAEGNGN